MGGLAQQSFIDNKKSKVIKDQGWIQLRKHNIVQKKKTIIFWIAICIEVY